MVAHGGRTRDAHAGSHHDVAADAVVVAELDLVVKLGAVADHGVLEGAAVDRRARADLDVVADHHAAHLRDLDPLALEGRKAEAVAADHAAGLEDAAVADDRAAFKHAVRVKNAVLAHDRVLTHDGARLDDGACANARAAAHDGERLDRCARIHLGALFNEGARMNARRRFDVEENLGGECKEGVRIVADEHGAAGFVRTEERLDILLAHDEERGPRSLHRLGVGGVREKGHVAFARSLGRHEARDFGAFAQKAHFKPSAAHSGHAGNQIGNGITRQIFGHDGSSVCCGFVVA